MIGGFHSGATTPGRNYNNNNKLMVTQYMKTIHTCATNQRRSLEKQVICFAHVKQNVWFDSEQCNDLPTTKRMTTKIYKNTTGRNHQWTARI